MRRRTFHGVLHNFLGTYTSRYSDYDGYWLFGMLVVNVSELQIDLLSMSVDPTASALVAYAIRLAAQKFQEQVEKAGGSVSSVREAQLRITRLAARRGPVNGRVCAGHDLRFVARVVSNFGKTYESAMSIFVAPHDSGVESRSTRGT
jgi:hypothetical protein